MFLSGYISTVTNQFECRNTKPHCPLFCYKIDELAFHSWDNIPGSQEPILRISASVFLAHPFYYQCHPKSHTPAEATMTMNIFQEVKLQPWERVKWTPCRAVILGHCFLPHMLLPKCHSPGLSLDSNLVSKRDF